MTTKTKWEYKFRLPHGHKFFSDLEGGLPPGRWAIADDSGVRPSETDDGVLLVDFDRPLWLDEPGSSASMLMPVRSVTGEALHTPIEVSHAMALAAFFDWPVRIEGTEVLWGVLALDTEGTPYPTRVTPDRLLNWLDEFREDDAAVRR